MGSMKAVWIDLLKIMRGLPRPAMSRSSLQALLIPQDREVGYDLPDAVVENGKNAEAPPPSKKRTVRRRLWSVDEGCNPDFVRPDVHLLRPTTEL
jgi:hypothetical protein